MRRIVLGIAAAVSSFAPATVQADDQQIADFIRSKLQTEQQAGNLKGFNIDMKVERGIVRFDGHTANATQEQLILKTAQQAGYLGVIQIVDDIDVKPAPVSVSMASAAQPATTEPRFAPAARTAAMQTPLGVPANRPTDAQQVQYQQQAPMAMNAPAARMAMAPPAPTARQEYAPMISGEVYGAPTGGEIVGGGEIISGGEPMPFASCGTTPVQGVPVESAAPVNYGGPAPMAAGYGGAAGPSGAPNLPGYAWPGYAAHPNYAAVSYPKQYSAAAWPYIGPFYPYPQVPLGWRKVTLEWDDGFWQLDFNDK